MSDLPTKDRASLQVAGDRYCERCMMRDSSVPIGGKVHDPESGCIAALMAQVANDTLKYNELLRQYDGLAAEMEKLKESIRFKRKARARRREKR